MVGFIASLTGPKVTWEEESSAEEFSQLYRSAVMSVRNGLDQWMIDVEGTIPRVAGLEQGSD